MGPTLQPGEFDHATLWFEYFQLHLHRKEKLKHLSSSARFFSGQLFLISSDPLLSPLLALKTILTRFKNKSKQYWLKINQNTAVQLAFGIEQLHMKFNRKAYIGGQSCSWLFIDSFGMILFIFLKFKNFRCIFPDFFEKTIPKFWKKYTKTLILLQPNFAKWLWISGLFHTPQTCWQVWKNPKPFKKYTWWPVEASTCFFTHLSQGSPWPFA